MSGFPNWSALRKDFPIPIRKSRQAADYFDNRRYVAEAARGD